MFSISLFNKYFLYYLPFVSIILSANVVSGQSNPEFQSTPVTEATYGNLYQYDIVVFDADGDDLEVIIQSGSLPVGITLNEVAGEYSLEGIPTETGDFPIILEVYETVPPANNATQSFSIQVNKAQLSVTADDQNIVYGDAIPPLTTSYSGFVNEEDQSDLSTAPTATTTANSSSGVGSYPITVDGGASDNYEFAYTPGNLNIAKADQTISFDAIPDKTYGDSDFNLSANSDSGLPVNFVVSSGPATLAGNTLTINGVGTIEIEAQQDGNANYNPAPPVSRSFSVSKAPLSVTADNQSIVYGDVIPPLTISYSGFVNEEDQSDLDTAPTATTTANSSSGVGSYPITVDGGASDNYEFAYNPGNLNIAKADQTISFDAIPDKTYGDSDFNLSANSDSGLPVSFVVSSGPATLAGNTLTINGVGTIEIEAQQTGNDNYNPAPPVSRSFSVSKAPLSVTADDQNIVYGDAIPPLTISYSGFVNEEDQSDLDTAPIATTTANSSSGVGNYPISVAGGASDNYVFSYNSGNLNIAKADQTISFDAIPDKTYGDSNFNLSANSDSGLPVSFVVASGLATLDGNTLTINGAGTIEIEAQQAGNDNYNPAPPVSRSFEVLKAEADIQISNTLQNFDGSPKEVTVTTQPEGLNYSITYDGSSTPPTSAGSYIVEIEIVEDNYKGQLISELIINNAPTTSGIPNQEKEEDSAPLQLNLSNYFSDIEDDVSALTFEIKNNTNPQLFSQVDLTNNILELSFEPNANGTSTITIRCTDSNGLFVEDTFEIELTSVQDPPFFTSSPVTEVLQDEEYQYLITTDDYDLDDVLSITNIISLPSWLSLNDNGDGTAVLSGSTNNDLVGVYGIALRVSDDKGNTADQFFDIEVVDVNDPPIFTSTPIVEAEVNETYTYNITTEDIDENDEVSIYAIEKPSWLTFSTSSLPQGNAKLQGTPTNDDRNSSQYVQLLAVDIREDSTYQNFEIIIDFPNTAPYFTSEPITEGKQGELYEYQITADDLEGDALTIKASSLPNWLNLDEEEWLLSGTPDNDAVGEQSISLEVEDFLGLTNSQTFVIEVENVNDPPVIISSPITTATQNKLYEYNIETEDIDLNDEVEISITKKPDWLNFDNQFLLSGIPTIKEVENSPFEVEIKATDLAGASDIQSFEIKVELENNPPTIDPVENPEALDEDSEETFTINLTGITDGGENSQEISLVVSTDLPGLFETLYIDYQSPEDTAELIYKILPDSFGIATVMIKVEDDGPSSTNSVETSFQIEVIPINDAPIFISNPAERALPNELYRYEIEVSDADPEDQLTISKAIGPEWLVLTDNKDGTAVLEGQVPAEAEDQEISILATDLQNASSTQSYLLRINEPPLVSDFTVQTDEDVPYQFKNSDFNNNYTDAEDDAIDEVKLYFSRGSIQVEGTEINSGESIKFNEELNLIYSPPQDFFGNIKLEWSASDGFIYSEKAEILMVVDTVNDKPILSNIETTDLEYIQGSEPIFITETITVSDIDDLTADTAWVQISENYNLTEDRLLLDNIDINDIEFEFNQSSGLLLITGNASKSDYELILRSVSYQNINSLSNDTNPKNISFIISDGEDQSKPISRSVQLSNILPELDIVNAFTPDGSGVNDTWDFPNLEAFEQVNISVYNTQGVRVYHCTENNCEWDGKFNQEELPAGTYFYLIKLNNGRRKYEGNVTILR
ncbi:MBG domain-containing protein [Marivirga tractuosa]|uniref:MBG domain-containing protein n=1 Tax=Marivirga tractuosa TaxID=1006 RepID=UPI0035CFC2E3